MIRSAATLAFAATASVASAGPYDAYKPPAVPPANMSIEIAEKAQEIEMSAKADIEIAQNDSLAPVADQMIPPAPAAPGEIAVDAEQAKPVIRSQSQSRSGSYSTARRGRQNVFQRLMELERRKNAWLRKTFLNR